MNALRLLAPLSTVHHQLDACHSAEKHRRVTLDQYALGSGLCAVGSQTADSVNAVCSSSKAS